MLSIDLKVFSQISLVFSVFYTVFSVFYTMFSVNHRVFGNSRYPFIISLGIQKWISSKQISKQQTKNSFEIGTLAKIA